MFHSFYLSEQQNQETENIYFTLIFILSLNKDKIKSLFVEASPLAVNDNRRAQSMLWQLE